MMGIFSATGGSVGGRKPYFGLRGGWLTFWVSVACSTDMTLFGYDQGVFGIAVLYKLLVSINLF